jgi:hypothetical protein
LLEAPSFVKRETAATAGNTSEFVLLPRFNQVELRTPKGLPPMPLGRSARPLEFIERYRFHILEGGSEAKTGRYEAQQRSDHFPFRAISRSAAMRSAGLGESPVSCT